jgi:hypothetical protein
LRDGDFNTLSRQARFQVPVRDDISIRRLALQLFDRMWPQNVPMTVRLVGFGVADFTSSDTFSVQGDLFGASPDFNEIKKRERLSDALDIIRACRKSRD